MKTIDFKDYRLNNIDLAVTYDTRNSDSPLSEHSHNFYEIVYIKTGGGLHKINEIDYPMLSGDIYIMSPNDKHSAILEKSLSIVNIIFQPTLFEKKDWEYLKTLPGLNTLKNEKRAGDLHKLALSPMHADVITGLYLKIKSECSQKDPGWEILARYACAEILTTISRAWVTYGNQKYQTHLSQGPVSKALQYIFENWDQNISVETLAKKVHLSKNYFGELFQNEIGMTIQQYTNKLKIDHARILLEDKSLSIGHISQSTGFEDANYFSRVFKKIYGITPKEYRNVLKH